MTYSLFADNQPAPEPSLAVTSPAEGAVSMPELGRLITLRDALLLLKVPLANSCGLQGMVESQLLSNDVHDRVLGKLKANTTDPALTSA
ncbi:hypothetical protein NTD86_22370 [Pseudomonas sp. 7P_10.2_Bac1]|uniref:hypothetical protein n=1 Tax=Pseudomonas sp. 7P_10.2_Bac1 TaxID=2971614 RepID=UPI0021C90825|nr:hypothetical protein [Pseudomonas sp. 7P_10.2_Bac1]MCU1729715.1 hypothetical protein [Pseudomonas sp. 7P_10.2_Bac1]